MQIHQLTLNVMVPVSDGMDVTQSLLSLLTYLLRFEIIILLLFDAFPHLSIGEKDSNDHAFGFAIVTYSDRELFDEYVACEIWLLGHGWSIGPVTSRDFAGFDKPILSHTNVVELGDCSRDTFVMETEKEAEERVGQSMRLRKV